MYARWLGADFIKAMKGVRILRDLEHRGVSSHACRSYLRATNLSQFGCRTWMEADIALAMRLMVFAILDYLT